MNYRAYKKLSDEMAVAVDGQVISLAGGYYGVQKAIDGAFLILALDLDGSAGWACWTENPDSDRCCDDNVLELGWVPSDSIMSEALAKLAAHVHN